MADNWVTSANITATTEESSFPVSNLANSLRHKAHRPTSMLAQRIIVDFGSPLSPGFVGLVGLSGEPLGISEGATLKVEFDNLNQWSSPALSLDLSRDDIAAYRFLDDQADVAYRYASIYYNDPENSAATLSYLYIGPYDTLNVRSNVSSGFQKAYLDPSKISESEGGARYSRKRTKYLQIDGLGMLYLNASDRRTMEQVFHDVGLTEPFFVSLDPTLLASSDLSELTRFVTLTQTPSFVHVKTGTYSCVGLSFREEI